MVNIFDYTDFREYLQCWFDTKKRENPRFSYQMFAQKASFNNRGFIFNIIKGNRKVSKHHCEKISGALHHGKKQAKYFEAMVRFTQARSVEERSDSLETMYRLRNSKLLSPATIGGKYHEYLSRWYYSAVRSLIDIFPVGDDFEFISKKLYPPISASEAKKSIELLSRLELIEKKTDGKYYVTNKNLHADRQLADIARNRFHREYNEIARQSILRPAYRRQVVSSLTLGISAETYDAMFNETIKYKERLLELAADDKHPDRVYQCQLILFPLTTLKPENGGRV